MAGTDYDAPRVKPEEQEKDEALEEARAKVASKGDKVDDEPNLDEAFTLPGADLSGSNSRSRSCRSNRTSSPA